MKGDNIHTEEMFKRAYGGRDWTWYRNSVVECIKYRMRGRWLDLGAGLGLFIECATRFGIDGVALERSEWAVKTAKERFPGIDIRQHFLEDKLLFENDTISTVMCHQVIEHLNKETVIFMLKESYRVLVPGGVILIYSPSEYDTKQRSEETHTNLYTPTLLKRKLKDIGFKVVATPNSARNILGDSRVGKYAMWIIFKMFSLDHLSATANCITVKPD